MKPVQFGPWITISRARERKAACSVSATPSEGTTAERHPTATSWVKTSITCAAGNET